MTSPVSLAVSTGFGVAMVTVIAVGSTGAAVVAAAVAVLAMLAGVIFRPAAAIAVLLVVSAIALGSPAPIAVAVAGLFAAGYLVLRYTGTVTAPTAVAAAGFTVVGAVATAFPLQLPWLPVLAPLAAFGCYLIAAQPFLGDWAGLRPPRPR
ncbi:MAG TPA: hypothetical protein VFR27_15860 [Mycobacterium sp.]|nr:hypothetical protein [Mycobacterium sp.]